MSLGRRSLLAAALLAATLPAGAPAQAAGTAAVASTPYQWRNVTVGGGGFAPGIVFSPAERGLAYLRTDMGGAYRWDDAARRWIPLEDALANGTGVIRQCAPRSVERRIAASLRAPTPAAR